MWGSRRRQHEQQDPADDLLREVGAQLREARLARGEELEQVAETLRIRPAYLRGLELGDLSVMPGRAYALGFLRSYARYLGFDGDDLIAQIRLRVAGLTSGTRLQGRTPLSESRLPKLPILALSLAALAGVYVGWAWVEDRSRTEVELVAEIPDELRQAVATARAPAEPDPPHPRADGIGISPALAPATASPPAIQPEAGAASAEAVDGTPAEPSGRDPAIASTADVEATMAATQVPVATAALDSPPAVEPAAPPDPDRLQEGPSAAEPTAQPAGGAVAALEPTADAVPPTVYRTGDAAGRVILRARTSAWVHVSSTSNDYLWVRTLQPGEAFVVPDRPDLVLWTGNAGGVEVIVDGEPLAPLGPDARVVRDVSLQPEDLLRRLAPTPAAGE